MRKYKSYEKRTDPFVLWVKKNGGLRITAELLGVSIGAVCRWMLKNRNIRSETAKKVVKLSNGAVSLSDIYKD